MKFIELECECGHKAEPWFYDASNLREREFEGVYFEVRETDAGLIVKGRDEDADYLDDFNMKKLSAEAVENIQDDLDDDSPMCLICPSCKEPLA